jgi:hypothetical protein
MTCEGNAVRLREGQRPHGAPQLRAQPEAKAQQALPARLLCAACLSFIAEARSRISVNGAHAHTFINPAGVIHKVGCFANAPGARAVGEACAYWTWFPGFSWRVAVCGGCGEHIGWCFLAAEQRFVALLLERIIEERGSAGSSG